VSAGAIVVLIVVLVTVWGGVALASIKAWRQEKKRKTDSPD